MANESSRSADHLTAFAAAEASLVEQCASAPCDAVSFRRKLAPCSLGQCHGTCCYDGVHVDADTAGILQQLAVERADDFQQMGLSLPDPVIVHQRWRGSDPQAKTAVRPFPFKSVVEDYPPHFDDTACVFLLADSRCALQVLAVSDDKHPWYYKPFGCWLHPIAISASQITLPDDVTDPYRFPDYDGFASKTFCGRTCDGGKPAVDLLRTELEFLGRLLCRDLFKEMSGSLADCGPGPSSGEAT